MKMNLIFIIFAGLELEFLDE